MKARKYVAVFVIVILFFGDFAFSNNRVYKRLPLPNISSEKLESTDYFEYIFRYLSIMLPNYDFTEVPNEQFIASRPQRNEFIYALESNSTNYAFGEQVNRKEFSINMYASNKGVIANTTTGRYVDTFARFDKNKLVNEVCGSLALEEKCLQYVDEIKGTCYTVAINNGFTMSMMGYYCPDAQEFATKQDRVINYLYEGFMSLEIPEEFSAVYPRTRTED